MRLVINGEQEEINETYTIRELLAARKVQSPDMVSVELNGTILKRADFDTIRIKENDAIEFLYFMGGGSRR